MGDYVDQHGIGRNHSPGQLRQIARRHLRQWQRDHAAEIVEELMTVLETRLDLCGEYVPRDANDSANALLCEIMGLVSNNTMGDIWQGLDNNEMGPDLLAEERGPIRDGTQSGSAMTGRE